MPKTEALQEPQTLPLREAVPTYGMLRVIAVLQLPLFLLSASLLIYHSAILEGTSRLNLYQVISIFGAVQSILFGLCLWKLLFTLAGLRIPLAKNVSDLNAQQELPASFRSTFFMMSIFLAWGGVETILILHSVFAPDGEFNTYALNQLVRSIGLFLIGLALPDLRFFLNRLRLAARSRVLEGTPPVRPSRSLLFLAVATFLAFSVCQAAQQIMDYFRMGNWGGFGDIAESQLCLALLEDLGVLLCGISVCIMANLWSRSLGVWKRFNAGQLFHAPLASKIWMAFPILGPLVFLSGRIHSGELTFFMTYISFVSKSPTQTNMYGLLSLFNCFVQWGLLSVVWIRFRYEAFQFVHLLKASNSQQTNSPVVARWNWFWTTLSCGLILTAAVSMFMPLTIPSSMAALVVGSLLPDLLRLEEGAKAIE